MPIHEYECPRGHVTEVFIGKEVVPNSCEHMIDSNWDEPHKTDGVVIRCMGELKRIIGKTDFSLRGPRWEKDGYSGTGTGTTTRSKK